MPPNDPLNPGQIDIRLVGNSELTTLSDAIKEMAKSVSVFEQGTDKLRQVAEQQLTKQFDAERRAAGTTTTAGTVSYTAPGARSAGHSGPEGAAPGLQSGKSDTASTGEEATQRLVDTRTLEERARELLQNRSVRTSTDGLNMFGRMAENLTWRSLPREREMELAREQVRAQSGVPSAGASSGGGGGHPHIDPTSGMPVGGESAVDPTAPAWQQAAADLGLNARMQMPQFGEWTAQNKIFAAAQGFNKLAEFRRDRNPADPTAGAGYGMTAALVGRASAWQPYIANTSTHLAEAAGLNPQSLRPRSMVEQYAAAGQSLEGNQLGDLPGLLGGAADFVGLGKLRQPGALQFLTTQAGRSALADLDDRLKGRLRHTGLDAEYLQQYLGENDLLDADPDVRHAFMDRLGRLFSQDVGLHGLSSETRGQLAEPALRAARAGNLDWDEWEESIRGVDEAAKAAQISQEEYAGQLMELRETVQELGGTITNADKAANQWSQTTGTMPGTFARLLQNPYVAGTISAQTGLLPSTIGALPGGALGSGALSAMRVMEGAYSGIGPKSQEIRDAEGNLVGEYDVSARAQREALTAQDMGIPLEEYKRLKRTARRSERAFPVQNALEAWTQGIRGTERGSAERSMLLHSRQAGGLTSAAEVVDMMATSNIGTREQRQKIRDLANQSPERARSYAEKVITDYTGAGDEKIEEKGRTSVDINLNPEARKWLEIRVEDKKAEERRRDKMKKGKGARPTYGPGDPDSPPMTPYGARPGSSNTGQTVGDSDERAGAFPGGGRPGS